MSDRTDAYMQLLDAIQNYVQVVHSEDHYARDWVLVSGIEHLRNARDTADVRLDMSPNTSNWAIYGLLSLGLDNFNTSDD